MWLEQLQVGLVATLHARLWRNVRAETRRQDMRLQHLKVHPEHHQ
jgi:hypothetical protein